MTGKRTPQDELLGRAEQPGSAFCPSCQRFVGPLAECPYCGEPARKSWYFICLRRMTPIFAFLGLALLYVTAVTSDIPLTQIQDVNPMMNFGRIRVRGTVPRKAQVRRKDNDVSYVSFVLNDGTGKLKVVIYGHAANLLVKNDRLPRRGQEIEITGIMNMTAGRKAQLRIETPRQLRLLSTNKIELPRK